MRTSSSILALGTLVAASLLSCQPPSEPLGPIATFSIPQDGQAPDLSYLPWPNDLYLDAGGHIALRSYTPLQAEAVDAVINADLATRTGFSVATGAFFPVTAGVDQESLAGHAVLVDLEADCPATKYDLGGASIPVVAVSRPEELLVHVRPGNGHVLLENHHYAYVLLNGITAGGDGLGAGADFSVIRDATTRPATSYQAHGWDTLKPLRDKFSCFSDPTAIVSAAVFTTESVTKLLVDTRVALYAAPAPSARVGYVYAETKMAGDDGTLEDLMGTAMANRPGLDNPGGIAHDGVAFVVQGGFDAIDFVGGAQPATDAKTATPTHLGRFHADGGKPTPQGKATVPFTLVLPKLANGASYANVPVVMFQHGLGGDRVAVLAIANTLAKAGIATFGIEIPFHGLRQAGATDTKHNITGADGPDGFGETPGDPAYLFFDIYGEKASSIAPLDPGVIRTAFQQSIADLMSATRLITEGALDEIHARDARLASLSFKGPQIAYASESFGSFMGGILLAVEPKAAAAVLSVGGAGVAVPTLTWSVYFGPIFEVLLGTSIGSNTTDEPIESDFGWNMYEFSIETGDPVAFMPYVIQHPLAGAPARSVLLFEAYHDESVPNISAENFAGGLGLGYASVTAGGTPDFAWTDPKPAVTKVGAAGLSGNVMSGTTPVTAAIIQYQTATHNLITRQSGTRTHDTTKRPFPKLPQPEVIANPIESAQAVMTAFFVDFFAGKTPAIYDK